MKVRARQLDESGRLVRLVETVMVKGDQCEITYTKADGGKIIVDIDITEFKPDWLGLGGA